MPMQKKFTKHALERMRIRGITKEEINEIINNHEKEINDNFGNFVSNKVKKLVFPVLKLLILKEKDNYLGSILKTRISVIDFYYCKARDIIDNLL